MSSPTTGPPGPIFPTATSSSQARKQSTSAAASHLSTHDIVPLDASARTTPIHASLPTIKLPVSHATTNTNPITLQPFSDAELKTLGYEKLRADYEDATTGGVRSAEIEKAREEAVRMLREKIGEREAKEREIDREIDEKEKIREVERKVYRKKMGIGEKGKEGG